MTLSFKGFKAKFLCFTYLSRETEAMESVFRAPEVKSTPVEAKVVKTITLRS